MQRKLHDDEFEFDVDEIAKPIGVDDAFQTHKLI